MGHIKLINGNAKSQDGQYKQKYIQKSACEAGYMATSQNTK
jgi:adenosyl cobinamide kinase/adenosyl cobinamide phosphate guanylyltransferase